MSKQELKRQILESGKAKMQGVVNDFQDRVNDLKAVTVGEENSETASQSEARVGGDMELIGTLTSQLDFAIMELDTLTRINPDESHDRVDFGAVVITDKRNLFVSTGIEEFECNGETYFGLSTKAPLYKNMAGSVVGDEISFHGINYTIKEIF